MGNTLCAFSSDSRSLYKGDIYTVLSMPVGYIVHFRYKREFVEDKLLHEKTEKIERDIIIFFTGLNKSDPYENIAVRFATIKQFEIVDETDLVHIYFELKDFVSVDIKTTDENKLPTKKFFSELDCEIKKRKESWNSKIELLQGYFSDHSFFYLKRIEGKGVSLRPRKDNKGSYFSLYHGKKYFLEVSLANPNDNRCKIGLSSSSDDVSFDVNNPMSISVLYDDIVIPMYIKSLNVSSESSFLTFYPDFNEGNNDNSSVDESLIYDYTINIGIDKKVSRLESIKFGIASAIAVLSIWSIKDNSSSLNYFSNNLPLDWKLCISVVFLVFSSSYLFYKFNKK